MYSVHWHGLNNIKCVSAGLTCAVSARRAIYRNMQGSAKDASTHSNVIHIALIPALKDISNAHTSKIY